MRTFSNMATLSEVLWRHWAFVLELGVPVVVGEMGGTNEGKDSLWHAATFAFYREKKIGFFYFCVNPESEDTGGLLGMDWKT